MNRFAIGFLGFLLAASLCFGQAAATPVPAPAVVGHGAFPVKTTKTLDSSKLKQDDTIEVETSGSFKLPDGTLVPKGSKLQGRVVSSKARSKGDPDSELTLAFDKLNIQGGKQLALKGAVQAVYPPADEPTGPNMATAGTSQGGSAGGVGPGGAPAGVNPGGIGITNAKNGSNTQSSSMAQPVIDTRATGVQGLDNLQLDNGVLTSKGKNVKLGSGDRMIVRVDIFQ
jgi:hypothetical protein